MNSERDRLPLTGYPGEAAEFLARLKRAGEHIVLTINGGAGLAVQDAASYRKLLDLAERLDTIQAIKDGLASLERGEGKALDDVFESLERGIQAGTGP